VGLGIKEQVFLAKYIETGGSISEAMKASNSEEAVKAHKEHIENQYIDPSDETERSLAMYVPGNHLKSLAKLEPRQRLFVREWLKDRNGKRAAIRAGYPPKTADKIAVAIMRRPEILQAVRDLEAFSIEKHILTADEVLMELSHIASSDVRELFEDETYEVRSPVHMPTSTARAIKSFEIVHRKTGKIDANGEPDSERAIKISFWDKLASLDKLAKFHGILSDRGIDDGLSQIDDERKAALRKALLRDLGDLAKPAPLTITQDGQDA
jgi:phage terminase small subunit